LTTPDIPRITKIAEDAVTHNANLLVPWYLISSFAYYILDESLITDDLYDRICFLLADGLDSFTIEHHHMDLCDMDALHAGTCYHLTADQYPAIVQDVARGFIEGRYP
jgi:hypothetical protein